MTLTEVLQSVGLAACTALVTGAAKRLGRACSLALAEAGVNVVVHYHRSAAEAEALCAELTRYGVRAWSLAGDLARNRRWEEALKLQKRLWNINRIFQKYALAACIKACLEIQGFPVGPPVPPQQPLSGAAREEVGKVLQELGAR